MSPCTTHENMSSKLALRRLSTPFETAISCATLPVRMIATVLFAVHRLASNTSRLMQHSPAFTGDSAESFRASPFTRSSSQLIPPW